jgi:hypothetical protein
VTPARDDPARDSERARSNSPCQTTRVSVEQSELAQVAHQRGERRFRVTSSSRLTRAWVPKECCCVSTLRTEELETEGAVEYGRFMQLLAAIAAFLGIGFAFGVGFLLAMNGYYLPLIIIVLAWAFAFARLGCLPPGDSH